MGERETEKGERARELLREKNQRRYLEERAMRNIKETNEKRPKDETGGKSWSEPVQAKKRCSERPSTEEKGGGRTLAGLKREKLVGGEEEARGPKCLKGKGWLRQAMLGRGTANPSLA